MEHFLTQTASHLWHQSWQIAAVFAAVASACRLLRRASAHGRYLLWLIVLAKCLVPPLVTVPLAVLPAAEPRQEQGEVAAANPTGAPARSDGPAPPSPVDPPAEVPKETTAPPVGAPPATGRTAPSRWTVQQWAAAGWIAGASAFLLFFLFKACRIQRRLGRTCRPASRYLQSEAADLSGRLGLGRPARLYLVDGLAQPFVWGLLRGSVFLPADLGEVTTAEQRRAILGHELAHIARRDALINALQVVVQGIFFFHPLVWWANRQIRREREKCCDETAIAVLGSPPERYSSVIVEALITERGSSRALSSLAVVGPVKALEERIRTIMTPNRRFHRRATWQAVLCALLLAALAVPSSVVLTASANRPEPPGPGRGDVEMVPCVRKYSVLLVVGRDRMTFEGRDVTWEKLPAALQQVAHRERTALAVAVADRSGDNEDKRKELMSLAARAARGLHFDHLSFTGVHPCHRAGQKWPVILGCL